MQGHRQRRSDRGPALRPRRQADDRGHRSAHAQAHADGGRGVPRALADFIDRQRRADKPFFFWFNSTRMHIFTHLKPESVGKTGNGLAADGMVEHDGMVGELLKKLDDLGIADNTIVSTRPTTAPKSSPGRTAA